MTQPAALRIVIAAGGTGGHLFPGLALAKRLVARYPGTDVLFVGHTGGLEERLLAHEGFHVSTVTVRALQGQSRLAQAQALGALGLGTLQALRLLRRVRPHLVIGAGGYVMGPVVLAATLLRVPRVLMEQNLIPGLTVRALARYAQRVFTSFPESAVYLPGRPVEYTGTPVREEICQLGAITSTRADGCLHLLVFGGSQGAHRINQAMIQAAPSLAAWQPRFSLVHQTGEADCAEVTQAYAQAGLQAEVRSFLHDMADRYRWADLVLCRSEPVRWRSHHLWQVGDSGTIPVCDHDHQRHNAMAMQRQGAAQVVLMPNSPAPGSMRYWSHSRVSPSYCWSKLHTAVLSAGPRRLTPSSRPACNCCTSRLRSRDVT